jgi:hypothetical protein
MHQQTLDAIPLWLLFVATCVFSWLSLEGGYRLGRWRRSRTAEEKETPVGAMVASILALFAFLLGFTFNMASTRFEARRQTLLNEANAIGTTYLRARLLHEPQRTESRKLLREYVDARVLGPENRDVKAAIARSEQVHELLWNEAAKEATASPSPITGLYIQSLNEMIDIHSTRVQIGLHNRIPTSIWVGLFLLSLLGMESVGYQAGLSATRRSPAMFGLILAFAGVLFLIADLDRPYEGFISVNQEALTSLQSSMRAEKQ